MADASNGKDKWLCNAMRKRPNEFALQVIMEWPSGEEALRQERILIMEYRQQGKKLYNCTDGGESLLNPTDETREKLRAGATGQMKSPETRAKIAAKKKGVPLSPEHRASISEATSGENNPMYGRTQTEESKAKNSESNIAYQAEHGNAMQGRKHRDESIAIMVEKATGRLHTEETRAEMSENRKGAGNSFFGKTHSEETREKLRAAAKKREATKRAKRLAEQVSH
jgi:hypothetical protein